MIIWSAVQLLLIVVLLPETFAPKILMLKARHLREQTGDDSYYAQHERNLAGKSLLRTIVISSTRVFQLLALEPMLALLCFWCAILLGILYLFFELFRECKQHAYNFRLLTFLHVVAYFIAQQLSLRSMAFLTTRRGKFAHLLPWFLKVPRTGADSVNLRRVITPRQSLIPWHWHRDPGCARHKPHLRAAV